MNHCVKKTLITSALPYANGTIHFGHLAGNNLPADVYARYCRMRGDQVLFLCGSDEYGMAVSLSAQLAGKTPQEHVDYYHEVNKQLFERMGMSWDHYSRTTWPGHIAPVQQFFLGLLEKGFIESQWSDQLYSPSEQRFLADRYVVGTCPRCAHTQARGDECPQCGSSFEAIDLINPRSKLTLAPLEKRATQHWFLRLDLFKEPLLRWLKDKHWKPNVMHFIESYIENLRPRAITRDSDWGVPVPLENATGKVLYVWFDAPIGYISAAMEWAQKINQPEKWKEFWCDPATTLVQFMGKDNITFHAVVFPAMIMGQKLPLKLVDEIPANEFYHLEGRKLSKSEGWSVDLDDFLDRYPVDLLRYMLAATAPENGDSEFSWREFQLRVNSELIGKWANLIHRTLSFISKMGGRVPPCHALTDDDRLFLTQLSLKLEETASAYAEYKMRRPSQLVMEVAQLSNVYFDQNKPWALLKEGRLERLETVIHLTLRALLHLAVATAPLLPQASQRLWDALGMDDHLAEGQWYELLTRALPVGRVLQPSTPWFQKIEDEVVEQELVRLKKNQGEEKPSLRDP